LHAERDLVFHLFFLVVVLTTTSSARLRPSGGGFLFPLPDSLEGGGPFLHSAQSMSRSAAAAPFADPSPRSSERSKPAGYSPRRSSFAPTSRMMLQVSCQGR
jgi:hypothetical protein